MTAGRFSPAAYATSLTVAGGDSLGSVATAAAAVCDDPACTELDSDSDRFSVSRRPVSLSASPDVRSAPRRASRSDRGRRSLGSPGAAGAKGSCVSAAGLRSQAASKELGPIVVDEESSLEVLSSLPPGAFGASGGAGGEPGAGSAGQGAAAPTLLLEADEDTPAAGSSVADGCTPSPPRRRRADSQAEMQTPSASAALAAVAPSPRRTPRPSRRLSADLRHLECFASPRRQLLCDEELDLLVRWDAPPVAPSDPAPAVAALATASKAVPEITAKCESEAAAKSWLQATRSALSSSEAEPSRAADSADIPAGNRRDAVAPAAESGGGTADGGEPGAVLSAELDPESAGAWRLGRVDAPLERLMFDETPPQEISCGAVLDELLESPSHAESSCRLDALRAARQALAAVAPGSASSSSYAAATGGRRVAVWFVEQPCGDQVALRRVPDADEAYLSAALVAALATLPRRSARQTRCAGAADASAQGAALLAAFRAALNGAEVEGLRCVPLAGDLARRLPSELGVPGVSAQSLPFRSGLGGTSGAAGSGAAPLAGAAFGRAKATVEELLASYGVSIFKIGITCNPMMRWLAYERDGYERLHLLYTAEEVGAVQMLEAALIDAFGARPGCRNVARGGEGPVGRGPYFTYLAIASCGSGVGLAVASSRKRTRLTPRAG